MLFVECVRYYQIQCVLNNYQIFVSTEIYIWIICLCYTQMADPSTSCSSIYVYVRLAPCTADPHPQSANKSLVLLLRPDIPLTCYWLTTRYFNL